MHSEQTRLTTIDVGLIGFGLAGRAFHAPVINRVPGLRLAAILQRTGPDAAELYPDARIVRSVEDLLAVPEIRLIVIATPNDTHFPLAKQCLAAGRDVVVDKPFATTFQEAAALVRFAQERRRLITVYQNRRFDGDFQAVQQIIANKTLGRVVRFETNYDRFRPQLKPNAWRERPSPGAGILFDIAPHLIDHALLLFGLPQAVTADVRTERDAALVDDAFDIVLHYSGALRAVLRSTILAAAARPRFVLHGTEASFVKQTFDPQENNLRNGLIPSNDTAWGAEPEENWGLLTRPDGAGFTQQRIPSGPGDYRAYYANVRDAILGRAQLHVAGRQALDVMRVLELAKESSRRRCTIPWA